MRAPRRAGWAEAGAGLLAVVYVLVLYLDPAAGGQVTNLFIFSIAAIGLNVIVGSAGMFHLGIAALFGIGVYTTGILTVPTNPFGCGFWSALGASTLAAAAAGVMLGAPLLRLRGDYFALVTLAFGEVVRFSLRNLDEVTGGTRALGPVPPPVLPGWLAGPAGLLGIGRDFAQDDRLFYWLDLALLLAIAGLVSRIDASRWGRRWRAVRDDELAAACLGINVARAKLSALALGSALAGLAGSLYAFKITGTASPDAYDFNRSAILLCAILVGGLASVRGAVVGTFLVLGFDNLIAPWLDSAVQRWQPTGAEGRLLVFSNWRLLIFGLLLIALMRFRPTGLLPGK
ncbi:MAG TPA: branched-chain amino acid ABC transporter permease [Pirellulales bacterium]|nr:branched-chain amino acid ABC transporter permease [Pirellulales bacterium]